MNIWQLRNGEYVTQKWTLGHIWHAWEIALNEHTEPFIGIGLLTGSDDYAMWPLWRQTVLYTEGRVTATRDYIFATSSGEWEVKAGDVINVTG